MEDAGQYPTFSISSPQVFSRYISHAITSVGIPSFLRNNLSDPCVIDVLADISIQIGAWNIYECSTTADTITRMFEMRQIYARLSKNVDSREDLGDHPQLPKVGTKKSNDFFDLKGLRMPRKGMSRRTEWISRTSINRRSNNMNVIHECMDENLSRKKYFTIDNLILTYNRYVTP